MGAGSNLKDRARAEVKVDSLEDEGEVEDMASSSNSSIKFRQLVSPSSSSNSLSLSQIQLQQFSRVAEAGAEDSKVMMAAVVMAVVGVECAGFARVQGTM